MEKPPLPTALYCRLSREDGDRMESDSIGNQRKLLEAYIENHPELVMAECYADDGYTGTNFQRPAFQRMLRDIENGRIRCVLVKDDCVIIEPTQKDLENQGFVAGSICF
jgi:site-specific DNA recombinase